MATGFLKISDMTLATGMNATDYFPVIQAGDNKRMTFSTALAGYSVTGHDHSGVYDTSGSATGAVATHELTYDHTSYITGFTETDPIFASVSANFAATDHLHTGVYSPTGHEHAEYITGFTESDPVFTAASGMFSVTGHTHADYITGFTESDPVFVAASGIFSVTGHTHADYITGFTESDPVFVAASGMFSVTGHDHTGVYQPLDSDLTAVAGITGTGFVKRTGAGTATVASINPDVQATDTKELAGFVDRYSTISITASSGEFELTLTKHESYDIAFYCNGVRYTKTADESISVTGISTSKTFWIYYDATGTMASSESTWSILNGLAPIAIVFYQHSSGSAIAFDERHSAGRNLQWHNWAHDTIGARLEGATSFQLTSASLPASFSIASGIFYDEDLEISHTGPFTNIRPWYRNSGLTFMQFDAPASIIHKQNGDATPKIAYDLNGTITYHSGATPRWYVYWLYASNAAAVSTGTSTPVYSIMGQAQYATSAAAQAATPPQILGTVTAELKLLYLVVYSQSNGAISFVTAIDKRFDSTVAGSSTSAIPSAATTTFVPYSGLASTNVQAALQELEDEKLGISAKAADSELLDGYDSAYYSTTGHDHSGTYVEDVTITADTVFPIDYLYKTVSGTPVLVTEIPKSNGIVAGGLVTWDSGLTFLVSPAAYYIEGTLYSTESTGVTLPDADPSNPRIDIIVVDTSEQVTYVTGVAAESPLKPQADPVTQIELTQVQINAGATGPSFVSTDEIIYDENTEWTGSVSGTTANWETTGAFHGSKCAEISTIGNADTIIFTGSSSYDVTDYETLILYIKLKIVMSSKQNIYVSFWNSTTQICTEYLLPINKGILTWQNISIPIASITFSTSTFNIIKLRWSMTGALSDHQGFYLDFMKLHTGAVQPVYTDTDNYVDGVTWTTASHTLTLQRTGTLADLSAVLDYSFLGLSDTPTGYTGASGFAVKVNTAGTALEFGEAGGDTFVSLSDTPTGYTGASGFYVAVNSSGTALEFIDNPSTAEILTISTVTGTTYTIGLSDVGTYIRVNNATGTTVTVPLNATTAFQVGSVISFIQIGAGTVSVTGATTGVTINAYDGLSTYGQYAGMQIIKVDTNVWDCIAGQG